jgi:uncharacterized protein YjbI with pentapeptide repeats
LRQANLNRANLSGADFANADLQGANLANAEISEADFTGALAMKVNADSANLQGANLAGANFSSSSLVKTNFVNTSFLKTYSISSLEMPQTYQDFYDLLNSYGCRGGVFLVPKEGSVVPVPVNFAEDSGIGLYKSKDYQGAIAYLCLANLSGAKIRSLKIGPYYFAGVNLSQADVSSSNLSQAVFEDRLSLDGWEYPLAANLQGIVYDALTTWPQGFIPPGQP